LLYIFTYDIIISELMRRLRAIEKGEGDDTKKSKTTKAVRKKNKKTAGKSMSKQSNTCSDESGNSDNGEEDETKFSALAADASMVTSSLSAQQFPSLDVAVAGADAADATFPAASTSQSQQSDIEEQIRNQLVINQLKMALLQQQIQLQAQQQQVQNQTQQQPKSGGEQIQQQQQQQYMNASEILMPAQTDRRASSSAEEPKGNERNIE